MRGSILCWHTTIILYQCTLLCFQTFPHLILPVVIWSPLQQFSSCIKISVPNVNLISFPWLNFFPADWANGISSENRPRLINCVRVNVILVSRVYCCDKHRVFAHHPTIINHFAGNFRCLPFHLRHRTGFTILLEHVTDMVDSGVSLRRIQSTHAENRLQNYHNLKSSRHYKWALVHWHFQITNQDPWSIWVLLNTMP